MSKVLEKFRSLVQLFSMRKQAKSSRKSEEFYVETEPIDHGPGAMKSLHVSIFQNREDGPVKIGEYRRNYSKLYQTFHPFQQDGKWYALYSKDYTCTSVMELPSCRDIAGEEPNSLGFCPVDFYVPYQDPHVQKAKQEGQFGFVAGCVWGDDTCWKIQFLDLSRIQSGVLVREERFGYLAMPAKATRLEESVSLAEYNPPDYPNITLSVDVAFNLSNGQRCVLGDN